MLAPCPQFLAEVISSSSEPMGTAILVLVLGLLIGLSVVLSRTTERLGVPIVLLFLGLGVLGGSQGFGHISFDNPAMAVRLGTIALILILFDGGLSTSHGALRQALAPATVLATLGVVFTAMFVAGAGHWFGLSWEESLLVGAVVSSTDAAAVFAVLRGGRIQLSSRIGRTLEVESCLNDPMAVILTMTIMRIVTHSSPSGWHMAWGVPWQLFLGSLVGSVLGYASRWLLHRLTLSTVGLVPVLTLATAFTSFGLATVIGGSGFLAVFLTAVVLGNGPLPYRSGLARVHDALAWMSQVGMFLMLGLLVFPAELPKVAVAGLGLGLFLAFVARPLAVTLCLLPFGYPPKELIYLGWVGLRGAVPIILATFPALAGIPGASRVFNIVFFIVVVSTIIPGATIRAVTRWLKLTVPEKPQPEAVLEINSPAPLNGELVPFQITEDLAVCGATLAEVEFPSHSAVTIIVRGRELLAPRGNTILQAGDHVYVFFHSEDRPLIELLFGGPESG